ncbi:candidate histidine kinase, hybrid [Ramlibacter tataouinensis TTB310]|uniref:histidine kinase n=2 Tax=Ramlibacter tataouinensis TaxID=94132 RepID=F5XZ70_RAMTT|nr:candidate histidine kinase, hybrid [Ramlibacter tataouinensis TTB310]
MRALEWHPTLGQPQGWPKELQALVSLMLNTRAPMFIAWGPQLRMLYNDAYLDILGDRHPAALGAPLSQTWAAVWPQVRSRIEATLAGQPQHFEDEAFTLQRRGIAELAWISFSYSPVYVGDKVAGLFCSIVETTQRVLAEKKAAEDKERLQQLFLQMPGMVGVVSGPDHVFEIANESMRELYGHRPLIGRPVREALPEMVEQGFVQLLDRVYTTGVPFEGKAVPALLPSPTHDGLEQRFFDFVYQPIRDAEGRVTGIFSQGIDVTEGALAAQKLRESEEWLRVMADTVPQIIWIIDRQGRAEFFNRQWTEYTGRAPLPATAAEMAANFVHPDDADRTLRRFEAAQREGVPFVVEHRMRRADGAYDWFLVRAEPLRHPESGEILRWFGCSTDIGVLKAAAEALQKADQRKDEFLATLAHELRNPLAPVVNAVTILRSPRATDEMRTRMLELMERQTRHLVRLVDDLLEVSRITRGKIELRLERTDLRAIAQACVDAAGEAIREAQHQVSLRVPAEPVWVQADPARMKQVIDNLLNNAIKYTPHGGTIEVEVAHAQGRACIRVQDNGAGIPPDMLDGVFELFAQVDHTIGRARGGLGIGLALVRQLVALHQGEVTAASGGIDAGSTFTVRLPLAPAEAPAPGTAAGTPLVPTTRPRRVLIIDDNKDAADTLASVVALGGHTTETAYDGPSGLAAAERMKPDCVLLDVGMPQMDGHEVARALRAMPALRGCLIVAVTGWGQSQDRQLTQASGFDAHLVKPASVEAVMELLEGL